MHSLNHPALAQAVALDRLRARPPAPPARRLRHRPPPRARVASVAARLALRLDADAARRVGV